MVTLLSASSFPVTQPEETQALRVNGLGLQKLACLSDGLYPFSAIVSVPSLTTGSLPGFPCPPLLADSEISFHPLLTFLCSQTE